MKKEKNMKIMLAGVVLLIAFALWTLLVCLVDVKPVGVNGSDIGFATLNTFMHELFGVHMALYNITDWLSILPIVFMFSFAVVGVIQLFKRKNIKKVDSDILLLGGFYIAVFVCFIFFEKFVVNYRPVLINGVMEASYPSSTTLLVMCVMPTAAIVLKRRIKNLVLRNIVTCTLIAFTIFMVVCRLISGVHWVSDIIGGALLSAGLVMIFYVLTKTVKRDNKS